MRNHGIRWTGLCWVWLFNAAVQLIPPINWYAFALIFFIIAYETGIWCDCFEHREGLNHVD